MSTIEGSEFLAQKWETRAADMRQYFQPDGSPELVPPAPKVEYRYPAQPPADAVEIVRLLRETKGMTGHMTYELLDQEAAALLTKWRDEQMAALRTALAKKDADIDSSQRALGEAKHQRQEKIAECGELRDQIAALQRENEQLRAREQAVCYAIGNSEMMLIDCGENRFKLVRPGKISALKAARNASEGGLR